MEVLYWMEINVEFPWQIPNPKKTDLYFLTFIFGRGDAHVEEHFSSLESFHTIYYNTSLSPLNVSIILIKICTFLFLKAFLLAMDVDLKKAFFG